ncbi:unnamed protein product [Diabrotica balteata]|uniref:Uncharacterized protein n=1 Tax=Diabrotica balteata TaxID=107213 RepID=A0A9P0DXR1_DIABA|nr:unnamed protein product [Diabrotica balteata]
MGEYNRPEIFIFVLLALIVKAVIFTCLCRRRQRIRRQQSPIYGPSVTTVTTTQHTQSPQVVPPYPIDTRHPVPSSNITGYGNQAPYPQYPFNTGHVSPPMAGATPYPPQPYQQAAHDYSANPPPYDVAVSQPPLQPPPSKEGYVKQSPYNPGYN